MRMDTDVVVRKYRDHLFAAAFHICENAADADDVVQDTFLKYHRLKKEFAGEEHIKAWLLRVAINQARNVRRSFWRRKTVPIEEYMAELPFDSAESESLFLAVMHLPEKYRIVIHLYYYEDYSGREISGILRISEGNVKVRLTRARKMLKDRLQEEWDDDEQREV